MKRRCSFSGPVQVDAAAKDEEDGELAVAVELEVADESREEEEDDNEKGDNEIRDVRPYL